jgi:CheY-like chemotaxis protein
MAHILLIEDDELLRDTIAQMLALDGHRVTAASDGEAGLEAFRRHRQVDLVITDILMPRMDGASMIVEMRKLDPYARVLAISGGRRALSSEFSLGTAAILGAGDQLVKPFTRADLTRAVTRAIACGSPA